MTVLDWRHHKLGKRTGKCRFCDRPTVLRDENGKPCMKVCAEQDLDRRAAQAAARYQTTTKEQQHE